MSKLLVEAQYRTAGHALTNQDHSQLQRAMYTLVGIELLIILIKLAWLICVKRHVNTER